MKPRFKRPGTPAPAVQKKLATPPPPPVKGVEGQRVLVTGGREYDAADVVRATLEAVLKNRGTFTLVHGAARGADTLASSWATSKGLPQEAHPVSPEDWDKYKKAAGHRRNAEMLNTMTPDRDMVVAFPGERGTAGCIAMAKKKGFHVLEIDGAGQ